LGAPIGVAAMGVASKDIDKSGEFWQNPTAPIVQSDYYAFNQSLDSNWKTGTMEWPGNNSDMQADNVQVADSVLNIDVVKESSVVDGHVYDFSGGEVQSANTYTDSGTFIFSIKNGAQPGTVGSAFLISPWQENWHQQEIDIEFIGDKPNGVQFNLHSVLHNSDGVINETNNQYQHFVELPFDTREGFHDYAIQLDAIKKNIVFLVDGQDVYHIENSQYFPDHPLEIRLNHWQPSDPNHWGGEIDKEHFTEATMQYKSVKILSDDTANILSSAIGFSALFTFVGSFLSTFIGAFIVKPVINLGKLIFSKIKKTPFKPLKIFEKVNARNTAIACGISGLILGMVKGGLVGAVFGPIGIVAGIFAGGFILGVTGFVGGYFSAKLFSLIVDLVNRHKLKKERRKELALEHTQELKKINDLQ
jgi:hypothetical protein